MLSEKTPPHSGVELVRRDVRPTSKPIAVTWLTGEVLLYAIIGLSALGLRLMALGERPLDAVEAQQSLAAWQLVTGQGVQVTGYSPLLFLGNAITFALFGASDFSARLMPVLLGMVLVFSPLLFRRWLGRWGALLASLFLAISPTALYFSRHLSSEIAVVACALLLLGLKMQFLESRDIRWLDGVAVTFALLLTAGPGAYAFLTVGILFAIIIVLSGRMGHGTGEQALIAGVRQVLSEHKGIAGRLLVLFVLTILLVSTCFLLVMPGFQAVIDQFAAWTAQLSPRASGQPWFHHLLLILFYEPLILVFALSGIILAFKNRTLLTTFLVFWGLVLLYAYTLAGGKSSGDLLLSLAPLALLAGLAAGRLLEQVVRLGSWEIEGLFAGILLPVTVYLLLQLTSYARTGQMAYVWLFAIGFVLAVSLFVGYLFWLGPHSAVRSLGIWALLLLILFTWGASWRLNYVRVSDPSEIMAAQPTDLATRDLFQTLEELSSWRSGDRHELPVSVVQLDDAVLRWYLRDFRDVRYQETLGGNTATQVYITPASFTDPALEGAYRGQQFVLYSNWSLSGLPGTDLINWVLYRTAPPPETQDIVLWAKGGGGLGTTGR